VLPSGAVPHVLLLADSLAFHGPERVELLTHPDVYPSVLGRALDADVDVVARFGWTARDIWWAVTKDPTVYSVLLPRADAVVIGVGGMDQLPASLPTYLREGLSYVRPGWLRRAARRAYWQTHPYAVRALAGRLRVLPQAATDTYLTRTVEGIRVVRPGVPIVAMAPAPWDSIYYPVTRTHPAAHAAALAWGERMHVPMLDVDPIVLPTLSDGTANADGMHWAWSVHDAVGRGLADLVRERWQRTEQPLRRVP